MLVLTGVLAALSRSDETFAFALGAAIGTVGGTLVIALLIRFVYTRFRRSRELWSPWLLVIAGTIGLFLALASAGENAEHAEELESDLEGSVRECAAVDPFLPLGAPFTYSAIDQELEEQLIAEVFPGPAPFQESTELKLISRNGKTVAGVVAFPLGSDDAAGEDFIKGVEEGAARQGQETSALQIGASEARVRVIGPGEVNVYGLGDCHGLAILAPNETLGAEFGQRLFTR